MGPATVTRTGPPICSVPDPAERLASIHRAMSWAKQQVASRGSGATMLLLAPSIAPTVLLPKLGCAPKLRTGYNLPISKIPGPKQELYWNGAHVEEIFPVSEVYDGMAFECDGVLVCRPLRIRLCGGREVLPDIETSVALTKRCLAELETAVGVAP